MVDHDSVTGFPLDNLTHLGEMLMDAGRRWPGEELVVWKSDIAEAYRLMPMHPAWQIKQVNIIDGQCYIDRNNAFGGSASGAIFIAFNSLVAWIAKRVKGIDYVGNYVDDSSGCGKRNDLVYYPPYGKSFPRNQTALLLLWDELGIPHKAKKQLFGAPLTIIGIEVDPLRMTFTLPEERKRCLIEVLEWWVSKEGKKSRLKEWYKLGGWVNWALNVYPLLRIAFNNFYMKFSNSAAVEPSSPASQYSGRKSSSLQLNHIVFVNNAIREDFT